LEERYTADFTDRKQGNGSAILTLDFTYLRPNELRTIQLNDFPSQNLSTFLVRIFFSITKKSPLTPRGFGLNTSNHTIRKDIIKLEPSI